MSASKVFISYSHRDARWLERLQVHLKPLERDGRVELWDDTRIRPGSSWRQEIADALATARVAVLLVSADFLASEFVSTNELPPLLAAARDGGARVLPIIVSPSLFGEHPQLGRFQAVNSPDRPLLKMRRPGWEGVLKEAAKAIYEALEEEDALPAPSPAAALELRLLREVPARDLASRVFDVVIANHSNRQLLLTELEVRWRYRQGWLLSIAQGMVLLPLAEYVVDLPIDPGDPSERHRVDPLDPMVAVPPANLSGPSLTTLRIQLHYHFACPIDWHPSADWSIIFDLGIRDDRGGVLPVFSQMSWRCALPPASSRP